MTIKIQAAGGKRAEILIHEPIGENWYGDGLTSRRFAKDLAALGEVDEILVRINSPGGAVFDSIAIYNALKNHGAQIEVLVEGLAASGASIIAMAGSKIQIALGAMFMIHNPWTFAMGEADDLREVADMLDQVAESMIDIYHAQTGLDRKELKSILDAETWYGASAAVEKGFADETVGEATDDNDDEKSKAKYEPRVKALGKQYQIAASAKASTDPEILRFQAGALAAAASFLKSASAGANEGVDPMSKEVASALTADDVKKAVEAARKAEAQRRSDIKVAFGKFSVQHRDLLDECLDNPECTAEAASTKLLAKLGEGVTPTAGIGVVEAGTDSRDKFIAGATNALLARAGVEKPEAGNEFNGFGLVAVAEHCLQRIRVSTRGLTRAQIAGKILAALSTSDFPQLLSNTAGKVLRKAYGNFPNTWNKWAAAGSVSDFKIHPRIQMGSFESLATIPEGGEYSFTSTKEEYENAQAATKGKAIRCTRQMLVNDDLGAFVRRAQLLGRAAARTVNNDAYAYLTSGSSNRGPTLADTGQYFNATAPSATGSGHGNLLATGTAISVANIGLMRAAMRKQKDKAVREVLNIEPKILLCSVEKEDLANEVVKSRTKDGQSNPELVNVHQNRLEVVSDPYLDSVAVNPWFTFADPQDVAAFEVVFLDGVQEPYIDERVEFLTDALELKTRLDYGLAPGDWRAARRNEGA